MGFWCFNVSLGAEWRREWKECGPLLLFNPLCTTPQKMHGKYKYDLACSYI